MGAVWTLRTGAGVTCALLLLATACDPRVETPASDATPPVASVNVVGLARDVLGATADVRIAVHADERPTVVGVADDAEGARSVALDGGFTVTCGSGPVGQSRSGTFADRTDDTATDGTLAVKQRVFKGIGHDEFRQECQGAPLREFHGRVRAVATNSAGATSRSGWVDFASASGPGRLRIASANLVGDGNPAFGLGPFATRLDGFAAALKDAEIVFLQEATPDAVSSLAARLGLVSAQARDGNDVSDVALLSKTALTSVRSTRVPEPVCLVYCPKGPQLILDAVTTVAGRPIRLVSLHWRADTDNCVNGPGSGCDRAALRRAASDAVKRIVTASAEPVLVVGDFNALAGASEMTNLVPPLVDATTTVTISRTDCRPSIDHVLSTVSLVASAFDWNCDGTLTDHPIVLATVGITRP